MSTRQIGANLIVLILFTAAATPRASAQCNLAFDSASYAVGPGAFSISVGDVNHDDHPDLAVVSLFDSYVSVLLGNGDGSFQAGVDYAVGMSPFGIDAADVNHDDHPDFVVASFLDGVSVLLGNGDGTFQPAVDYAAGNGPESIAIVDVNQDGDLDVATAAFDDNAASILLGNGDGTFQSPVQYGTNGRGYWLAAGDLSGDTIVDLVVVNDMTDQVSVLLGNGNGSFQAAVSYPVGDAPFHVAIGDLNGDDRLDVVAPSYTTDSVSVLLGNGDGTLQATVNYAVGVGPETVAIGDVNSDGIADLATANDFDHTVTLLLGHGDGTFQPAMALGGGPFNFTVAIDDLNCDDRPDIVLSNPGDDTATILVNDSDSFPAPTITEQPAGRVVGQGEFASLEVTAITGSGLPLSYRWFRDGVPVANGGHITGATTRRIRFNPAMAVDEAHYFVEVSLAGCDGGMVVSDSQTVVLAVIASACDAEIVDAKSLLMHGAGPGLELAIDLDDTGGIESRQGGPERLVFAMSEAINPATVVVENVQVDCAVQGPAVVDAVTLDDVDVVAVRFAEGLSDVSGTPDCCTVSFAGMTTESGGGVAGSYQVHVVPGDIDFNGGVTGGDAAIIKPTLGQIAGVDLAGPQFDFDLSGGVTGGDYSLIKPLLGNVGVACP